MVVGFVVGGGFFLLIVVGSGVGCRWVWVAGRGGFVLRYSKHTMQNIFWSIFLECKQTLEKQTFYYKSFAFTNILWWRMFYVETNGALMESFNNVGLNRRTPHQCFFLGICGHVVDNDLFCIYAILISF